MSSPHFTTSNELFSLLNDEAIYDEVITAQFTDDPSFNIDFQLSGPFTPFQEQVQVQTNCSDIQYPTQVPAFPFRAPTTTVAPSYANTCASLPSNTSFYHNFAPSPAVNRVPSPQFEIPVLYYSFPEVKITETHYSGNQYQPANPLYSSNDSYTSKSYQSFRSTTPSKPKSRSYPTSPQDPHSPTTSPSTTPSPSTSTTTSPRSQTTLHPTSASETSKPHSRAQSQSPPRRTYKPKEPKQQRRNDHSGDFRKVFFQQLETDMSALAEWTTFMASHGCPKPRVCVRTHLAFCDMRTQKYGEKDSFAALRLNPKWRRLGSRTFCECMSFGPCYVAYKS